MEIRIFKTKWYYRLIKVIYITVFTTSIIVYPVLIFMDNKPYKVFDDEKSTFTCIEANVLYPASKFDLYSEYLYSTDKEKVIDFCKSSAVYYLDKVTSEGSNQFRLLKYKYNGGYKINAEYKQYGKGVYAVGYAALTALGVFAVLELIKRVVFYIITGRFIHLK